MTLKQQLSVQNGYNFHRYFVKCSTIVVPKWVLMSIAIFIETQNFSNNSRIPLFYQKLFYILHILLILIKT